MDKVILFGSKAIAVEACYCLKYFSDYSVAGFTVEKEWIEQHICCDLPVVPFEEVQDEFPPTEYKMFIAVGYVDNNKVRKEKYLQVKKMGYELINVISSTATIYSDIEIGDNCFIGHHTTISPNVKIGNNVIIGNGCTIGHDVVISDHCFLSNDVAISGSVTVGSHCYLGTNCTIRNKVVIGQACVVGAGAIALENIEDKSVLMGHPAELLPISSDKLPLG